MIVSQVFRFSAPVGRSMDEFLRESQSHGWLHLEMTRLYGKCKMSQNEKPCPPPAPTWDTTYLIVLATGTASTWCQWLVNQKMELASSCKRRGK